MLQEKIVKEEMIFIQPHIKLGSGIFFSQDWPILTDSAQPDDSLCVTCSLNETRKICLIQLSAKLWEFTATLSWKRFLLVKGDLHEDKILQEEHELRVMQRTGSLMYRLAHKVSLHAAKDITYII